MEFSDNQDLALIAEAVDAVCGPFDDDYWSTADRDHRFPVEFFDAMAENCGDERQVEAMVVELAQGALSASIRRVEPGRPA